MSRGGVFDIALEGDQLDTPLGRKILTESLAGLYQIIAECHLLMRNRAKRVIFDATHLPRGFVTTRSFNSLRRARQFCGLARKGGGARGNLGATEMLTRSSPALSRSFGLSSGR